MRIVGMVNRIEPLEEQEGKKPLVSVSIEGFSVLARPEVMNGITGGLVSADVSVQWREKKRPLHWLQSIERATVS